MEERKRNLIIVCFILMIIALFSSALTVSAATRTVKLKKNKTVTVYATRSDTFRLMAVSKLKWTSSKKTIATVRGSGATGIAKPLKVGTTIIKGTKGNVVYTCKFIVENPKINKTSLSLKTGKGSTLKISGTKQTVKWSSSNKAVCTVSSKGLVSAKGVGTAVVTASVGSYLKYRCNVTVTAPPVVYTDSWYVKNVEFDCYPDENSNDLKYYAIATIHNNGNTSLYLKDCVFDIEDSNGHLIQTDSLLDNCPAVLLPGEDGYFFSSYTKTIKGIPTNTALYLKVNPVIKRATGTSVRYDVSDISLRRGIFDAYKIIGRVTKNASSDKNYVYVYGVFFDSSGKAIGATGTTVRDIIQGVPKSFEVEGFMCGSRKVSNNQFSSYRVIAEEYYYQYDR